MFKTIVCVDIKNGISRRGRIPWDVPADRKIFRDLTSGGVIIVGGGTFLDIHRSIVEAEEKRAIISCISATSTTTATSSTTSLTDLPTDLSTDLPTDLPIDPSAELQPTDPSACPVTSTTHNDVATPTDISTTPCATSCATPNSYRSLKHCVTLVCSSSLYEKDEKHRANFAGKISRMIDEKVTVDMTNQSQSDVNSGQLQVEIGSYLVFKNLWDIVEYCQLYYKSVNVFVAGGSGIYEWFISNRLIVEEYICNLYTDEHCDNWYPPNTLDRKLMFSAPYQDVTLVAYKILNREEQAMLDVIGECLASSLRADRTLVNTYSVFGRQFRFNLVDSFPLMTSRKTFIRGVFEELMLYLRGQTDSKILEKAGVNVWKHNTSATALAACGLDLPVGDMGHSYGHSMRHFGADYKDCMTDYTGKGFDQLTWLIDQIRTDPTSRRLIISLWEPNNMHKTPLPPCLYMYQFYVSDGYLSCMMTQRSSDFVVAGGWNVATGALLCYMIARQVDLKPKTLIWNVGDLHVYSNLIDQANELRSSNPVPYPRLFIPKKPILEYEFTDLILVNYNPKKTIKMLVN